MMDDTLGITSVALALVGAALILYAIFRVKILIARDNEDDV